MHLLIPNLLKGKLESYSLKVPSVSPWRDEVLVRMVIDYSQTLNRFTELDAYPVP